jgi:hypothetical protein
LSGQNEETKFPIDSFCQGKTNISLTLSVGNFTAERTSVPPLAQIKPILDPRSTNLNIDSFAKTNQTTSEIHMFRSKMTLAGAAAIALLLCQSSPAQLLPQTAPAAAPRVLSQAEKDFALMTDADAVAEKWIAAQKANDIDAQIYALTRLTQLKPYATSLMWELARTFTKKGDRTGAFDTLLKLQQQGLSLNPAEDAAFDPIKSSKVFTYIVDGFKANAKTFGEGKVLLTIQNDTPQIESLAFDTSKNKFVVASARTGEIFWVDMTGKTSLLASPTSDNGLYGIYSLVIDAKRNALYAASSALPSFQGYSSTDRGFGNISQFELSTGKFVKKVAIPFDGNVHVFSSMAVAPSGEVYGVDVATNGVYQLRAGVVRRLFSSPEFVSLRGIAVSPDHKRLFISDYENGLFAADLEKAQIVQVPSKNQNLGGIDGLYSYFDQLIAIQCSPYA